MNRGGPSATPGTRPVTQSLKLTPGRLPSTASQTAKRKAVSGSHRNPPTGSQPAAGTAPRGAPTASSPAGGPARRANARTAAPRSLPQLEDSAAIDADVLTGEASSMVHSDERSPAGIVIALCVAAVGLALAGAWAVKPSDAAESGLWSVLSIETFVSVAVSAIAVGLVLSKRPIETRLAKAAFATLFVVVDVIPLFTLARVGTSLTSVRVGLIDHAMRVGDWANIPTDRGVWAAGTAAIAGFARILGLDTARSLAVWLPAVLHLGLIVPAVLWSRRLNSAAGRWITIGFVIIFGGFGGDVLNGDAIAALFAACLFAAFSEQFDEFGSVIRPKALLPNRVRQRLQRRERAGDEAADHERTDEPGFTRLAPDRRAVPRQPVSQHLAGLRHDRLAVVSILSLVAIALLSLPVLVISAAILVVFALKDLLGRSTKLVAWVAAVGAVVAVGARVMWSPDIASSAPTSRTAQAVALVDRLAFEATPSWASESGNQRFWAGVGLALLALVTLGVIRGWSRASVAERIVVAVGAVGGMVLAGPGPLLGRALLMTSPAVGVMVARKFDDLSDDQDVVDRHSLGITLLAIGCILATFGFNYANLAATTVRDSDVAAVEWIVENSPPNAVVLTAGAAVPWNIDTTEGRWLIPIDQGGKGKPVRTGLDQRIGEAAAQHPRETTVLALLTVSAERVRLDPVSPNVSTNGQLAQALSLTHNWMVVYQSGGSFVLQRTEADSGTN